MGKHTLPRLLAYAALALGVYLPARAAQEPSDLPGTEPMVFEHADPSSKGDFYLGQRVHIKMWVGDREWGKPQDVRDFHFSMAESGKAWMGATIIPPKDPWDFPVEEKEGYLIFDLDPGTLTLGHQMRVAVDARNTHGEIVRTYAGIIPFIEQGLVLKAEGDAIEGTEQRFMFKNVTTGPFEAGCPFKWTVKSRDGREVAWVSAGNGTPNATIAWEEEYIGDATVTCEVVNAKTRIILSGSLPVKVRHR